MKFIARVAGYGTLEIEADTRELAERIAEGKRRRERALNKLVWRADLATDYDKFASMIAGIFADGRGVDAALMRKLSDARARLPKEHNQSA